MRRITTLLLSIALCFGIFTPLAPIHAQGSYTDDLSRQLQATAGDDGAGFERPTDPRAVAAFIIRLALGFLGIIVLSYIIFGGYMIMTAQGNQERVDTGKKTVRNGVIGMAVVLSAYSLTLLAFTLATGDEKRSGDYIEIQKEQHPNPDPSNRGINAFSPLPPSADGNNGVYLK
ncbi:MAG: hypothetical protein HOE53_00685 [Candidatus Magasanikbacteria bacterium]|jgi:hypothetical protein|nr:hypothetical protein [Candidatus Magasanikbacteria bacterium]